MKQHKGRISHWEKYFHPLANDAAETSLGYIILGIFEDHPQFAGRRGTTSFVVKHDEETGEIETRNSKYTLVGPTDEHNRRGG